MSNREEMIAVVKTYMYDGLIDHNPDAVLFDKNCERWEMGYITGGSGEELRNLLKDPAYEANKAIHNARWMVDGEYVDCRYDLELHDVPETMRIASRYHVVDGLIRHIEVMICAGAMHEFVMQSVAEMAVQST